MKRTYGRFGFSVILMMFGSVLFAYIILLQRIYTHWQRLLDHGRQISSLNIAIALIVFAAFTITLFYFIRRYIARKHIVTVNGNEIIISPLHPFSKKIKVAIKEVTKVDFIANKAKPELTLITQNEKVSMQIAGNYVEITNLSKALMALGLPTEISGPSANYFTISSKELLQKTIMGYSIILTLYMILFVKIYLSLHAHRH